MKRKISTILYCAGCRMTTPHAVSGSTCTCNRCGMIKTLQFVKSTHKYNARMEHDSELGSRWN